MKTNDGGPAFPVPPNEEQQKEKGWEVYPSGMSLRDYFAGQAMIGISPLYWGTPGQQDVVSADDVAETSYELADAMLKAREA